MCIFYPNREVILDWNNDKDENTIGNLIKSYEMYTRSLYIMDKFDNNVYCLILNTQLNHKISLLLSTRISFNTFIIISSNWSWMYIYLRYTI